MSETTMSLGQQRELHAAVIRAMPAEMGHDRVQAWIDDPGALRAFLARMNFPLAQTAEGPFRAPLGRKTRAALLFL